MAWSCNYHLNRGGSKMLIQATKKALLNILNHKFIKLIRHRREGTKTK